MTQLVTDGTGTVWTAHSIFRIQADDTFVRAPDPAPPVQGRVAVDPQGSLWILSRHDFDFGEPDTLETYRQGRWESSLITGLRGGIAFDPAGRLWSSDSGRVLFPRLSDHRATLVSAPPPLTSTRSLFFVFGAAFGESNGTLFSTRLNGPDPLPASSWSAPSFATSVSFEGVPDGHYAFQVRAHGSDGRVQRTPTSIDLEVDATAPEVELLSPSGSTIVRDSTEVRIRSTDSRLDSLLAFVRFVDCDDGSQCPPLRVISEAAVPGSERSATWVPSSATPDGAYRVDAQAIDELGLATTVSNQIVLDARPPFVDLVSPARVEIAGGRDVWATDQRARVHVPAPLAQHSFAATQHWCWPSQHASPFSQHGVLTSAAQQAAPASQQGNPKAQQSPALAVSPAVTVAIAIAKVANEAIASFVNMISLPEIAVLNSRDGARNETDLKKVETLKKSADFRLKSARRI